MSGAAKPKRRAHKPRLVPLFMLGSDGYVYACAPLDALSPEALKSDRAIVALRLTPHQRGVALDALQVGAKEAARALQSILGGVQ